MYSLDTSMFMDWQARYYPLDVFRSLEQKLRQLIDAGECAAVSLVKEEIDSVGTPGLQAWAKGAAGLFVPLTTEIQQAGAAIEAMYPDLLDPKSPYQSADVYVIALAQIRTVSSCHKRRQQLKSASRPRTTSFRTCAVNLAYRASTCSA